MKYSNGSKELKRYSGFNSYYQRFQNGGKYLENSFSIVLLRSGEKYWDVLAVAATGPRNVMGQLRDASQALPNLFRRALHPDHRAPVGYGITVLLLQDSHPRGKWMSCNLCHWGCTFRMIRSSSDFAFVCGIFVFAWTAGWRLHGRCMIIPRFHWCILFVSPSRATRYLYTLIRFNLLVEYLGQELYWMGKQV
jgi:hypothetical protein